MMTGALRPQVTTATATEAEARLVRQGKVPPVTKKVTPVTRANPRKGIPTTMMAQVASLRPVTTRETALDRAPGKARVRARRKAHLGTAKERGLTATETRRRVPSRMGRGLGRVTTRRAP